MRAEIKVTGLSPGQAEYLRKRVPVTGREFLEGIPRQCVVFELEPGVEFHIEMDTIEYAGVMSNLEAVKARENAARLLPTLPTPDQIRNLSAADAVQLAREMNR